MKKTGFIIGLFIFLFIFSSFAWGLDIYDYGPDDGITEVDGTRLSIKVNKDGTLLGITYTVSSTGATSGIRYRTSAITIEIYGQTTTIDISNLGTPPSQGQTVFSQIAITKEDIIKSFGEQHRQLVETAEPNDINIGAHIQIYNAGTGKVLDTIRKESEVSPIAGKYGFGSKDINDMKSRYQQNYYPIYTDPDEEPWPNYGIDPDPSGTGLRPSVLIE